MIIKNNLQKNIILKNILVVKGYMNPECVIGLLNIDLFIIIIKKDLKYVYIIVWR